MKFFIANCIHCVGNALDHSGRQIPVWIIYKNLLLVLLFIDIYGRFRIGIFFSTNLELFL